MTNTGAIVNNICHKPLIYSDCHFLSVVQSTFVVAVNSNFTSFTLKHFPTRTHLIAAAHAGASHPSCWCLIQNGALCPLQIPQRSIHLLHQEAFSFHLSWKPLKNLPLAISWPKPDASAYESSSSALVSQTFYFQHVLEHLQFWQLQLCCML